MLSPGARGLGAGGAGAAGRPARARRARRPGRGRRGLPRRAPRRSRGARCWPKAFEPQPGVCSTSCAAASPTTSPSARRRLACRPPYDPRVSEPADLSRPGACPPDAGERISIGVDWPERVTREWAFGGATGKGVRVCILDSGRRGRPSARRRGRGRGRVLASARTTRSSVDEDTEGDLCGHGTACAGIVRALAPECELYSVRVLGAGFKGSGPVLLAGLRWAVEQGFDVINMSLSTTKRQFAERAARARRHARTSSAPCSSPPRTTCRSRATRGASRR